jgi:hypothetical protein
MIEPGKHRRFVASMARHFERHAPLHGELLRQEDGGKSTRSNRLQNSHAAGAFEDRLVDALAVFV